MPASKVSEFISRASQWREEMKTLRSILLDCGLEEDMKWGKPCFALEGQNVAILQPFKASCALMFFKGTLLKDTHGMLRSPGENSQYAKRLEFTSADEIKKSVVASYVKQAIAVEKAGLKVEPRAKKELQLPEELARAFAKDRKLAKAFEALTPGRQRAYVMHISGAKQAQTRIARIEKCTPAILAGKGLNDR